MRTIQYRTKNELSELLSAEKGKIFAEIIENEYYSVLWFNFLNSMFDKLEKQLLIYDNDSGNKYLHGRIDSILQMAEEVGRLSKIKKALIK